MVAREAAQSPRLWSRDNDGFRVTPSAAIAAQLLRLQMATPGNLAGWPLRGSRRAIQDRHSPRQTESESSAHPSGVARRVLALGVFDQRR